MDNDEFVKGMKDALRDQENKAALDQQERLEDARVLREQGDDRWDALTRKASSLANQIGKPLAYYSSDVHEPAGFRLVNSGRRELKVERKHGTIFYSGCANGSFEPANLKSNLVYRHKRQAGNSVLGAIVSSVAESLTAEQVAERLVAMAVNGD